ncbi:hypothetical protein DPMN_001951 [Dreissena polymorpha]|uniref:Uncharacterized protein n=1 Tax=Dreissena polymorpha TaxID=45954 RepID=A0A9D4RRA8_DREPO|nr:hypothetical protein DPMN_001941 [Dreissena polymorpha]KAH3878069.1 hypothetical protein DPMN_001951 [Dreissena polymorpha]
MPSMTGSPCEICQCFNGSAMCASIDCPACEGPTPDGQCCPICGPGSGIGN